MRFFVFSEQGLDTQPLEADTLADAAALVKQLYGDGLNGDGVTPVSVGVLLPVLTATVNPGQPPTLTMSGDEQTQANLLQAAQGALAANAAYLGLATPTTAQAVAQVKALTQQVNGLIEFVTGKFT